MWGKSERAVTGWIDSRGRGLSLICRTESFVHERGEREREGIELTDEMRFSAISYQQPQPGDSDLDPGSKPDTVHSTPSNKVLTSFFAFYTRRLAHLLSDIHSILNGRFVFVCCPDSCNITLRQIRDC